MTAHAPSPVADETSAERTKGTPSGRLLLRMPRTLHAELARAAEREGTSLNQFITSALTRTVSGHDDEPAGAGSGEAASGGQSRVIAAALVANAVVIGLAAIAAIAVLLVALLG